jgi:hypothetical protein
LGKALLKNKMNFKENYINWIKALKKYKFEIIFSLIFAAVAISIDLITGSYADKHGSVILNDPLLKIIPAYSFLGPFYIYGIIFAIALLLLYPLFYRVKDFMYTLGQFNLLLLIRSLFIYVSGFKGASDAIVVKFYWPFEYFDFQNDLFFSGHVAVPLLGFFIFKDNKVRWFFLLYSVFMAFVVLFGHLHYTVDVLGALFITYSSYALGHWIFDKWLRK